MRSSWVKSTESTLHRGRVTILTHHHILALLLILVSIAFLNRGFVEAQESGYEEQSVVFVLNFDGPITPVLQQYLEDAIAAAITSDAEAIILRFDTPGGSVNVTNAITQLMLASPVPIIAYVAPSGARAGSAGTFVTLAAHVAAMAPGASIGAASPVDMSGGEINETMRAKIENLLSADVENLAGRRGEEATEWAIAAVREASAATANQALELGVIDFIAENTDDLLQQMDGFEVIVNNQTIQLHTADATQVPLDLTPLQQLLNFIADPTIATLLLSLGMLGLFVEIRTPGFGFPGVVGLIALLLAFFGLGQIDANMIGIVLMAAAMALFIAEAFTPTFGVLALGGVTAFIFGAALLFNTPGVSTPWPTIIVIAVAMGAFVVFAGAKAYQAQKRKPITGEEGLVGETALVKQAFSADEDGSVFIQGEWWNARLDSGSVKDAEYVRILKMDGYTLVVQPIDEDLKSHQSESNAEQYPGQ